jgi:hypothetical protein
MNGTSQSLASVLEPPPAPTLPGRLVTPGDYLIELAFARPVRSPDVLVEAMGAVGFSAVCVDESLRPEEPGTAAEWGEPGVDVARIFLGGEPFLVRFFAKLDRPIVALDGPEVAWLSVRKATLDVYAEIRENEPLLAHELRPNARYEVRFVSRMRGALRTRAAVAEALRTLAKDAGGFKVDKLSALKRDMRLPGRPGASDTLWYAVLEWTGPETVLTIEDPIYFQDVKELTS